jgi:hypothetical protein
MIEFGEIMVDTSIAMITSAAEADISLLAGHVAVAVGGIIIGFAAVAVGVGIILSQC